MNLIVDKAAVRAIRILIVMGVLAALCISKNVGLELLPLPTSEPVTTHNQPQVDSTPAPTSNDPPSADFNRLARRLGLIPPEELEWARVSIDDRRKGQTPIANIEYADGSKQNLDIFTAIRENITTVGNPIMLIAIYHWYEIIRHRAALTFKDIWNNKEGEFGEAIRSMKKHNQAGLPDMAAKNLYRISETIIEAARSKAITREEAFVAYVRHFGYHKEDTWLHKAFEWLRDNKSRRGGHKLDNMEKALRSLSVSDRPVNDRISIFRIMDFLRDARYAHYIRPKEWKPMRNAYLAWHFDVDQATVVTYFSKVRRPKDEIPSQVDSGFFYPRANSYDISQLGEWLLRLARNLPDEAVLKDGEEDQDLGPIEFGE